MHLIITECEGTTYLLPEQFKTEVNYMSATRIDLSTLTSLCLSVTGPR